MKLSKKMVFIFISALFIITNIHAEPNIVPAIEKLSIGQDQSVLRDIPNLKETTLQKLGIKKFKATKENGRTLIISVDSETRKSVRIALAQDSDMYDQDPVFGHFRFNQTRRRDIIDILGKPTLTLVADENTSPDTTNKEIHNYLNYRLQNGQILSFRTKERDVPEKPSFLFKINNIYIIDPPATYRVKADTRIADGFLKAIILMDPAYAERLTGQKIIENSNATVPFIKPKREIPQTKSNFSITEVYNTGTLYKGPKHNLSFSERNKPFRSDQTSIREIVKKEITPIFASEYAVIPVYFSPSAHDYYFYNLRTGAINKFPVGTEKKYLKLLVRPDRSLLEARWEEEGLCKNAYYHFDREQWKMMDTYISGFEEACENVSTILIK